MHATCHVVVMCEWGQKAIKYFSLREFAAKVVRLLYWQDPGPGPGPRGKEPLSISRQIRLDPSQFGKKDISCGGLILKQVKDLGEDYKMAEDINSFSNNDE